MNNYKQYSDLEIYEILKDLIKQNRPLCILCHVSPDGDCIGSSFALKLIYESMGGTALVLCSDKSPNYLKFLLIGQDSIKGDSIPDGYSVCSVDVSNAERLGVFEKYASEMIFMIDHHAIGVPFANGIVEGRAAASAEIIARIYKLMKKDGYQSNPDISRCLYAAISSDTGSFKYSNTTANTFLTVSEIITEINDDAKTEDGMDTAEIARRLYDCKSEKEILANRIALENLSYVNDGKIAYTYITLDEFNKYEIEDGESGSIVDIPRSIEGVEIGLTLKQKDINTFKLSARSNTSTDVAKICAAFGGGGHKKAAGATITANSMEEAISIVLSEFCK